MSTLSELPKSIGKYQIRRTLGDGAMGVVYEGFDPGIERRVAIKVLHPYLICKQGGEEFLERFKREAISAAKCTHQNVVAVHEYGQDGDTPFIAMEYIEGASLNEILKSGRKISLKNILSIIGQLLSALNSAHKLEIIHRDIKTANIIILKDGGGIKLADFGIAQITDSSQITMTGAVVGTPKYMSPEQMFGLKTDNRADLFSVAMVFIELLAAMPKDVNIPCSSLPTIEGLPPNNRIDYATLYPNALIPVLIKGLAQMPADRFQNAKTFLTAIKQALPNLKTKSTAESDNDATVIGQKPMDPLSDSTEQLDSMTQILSGYIGPIAKNIMYEQRSHSDSLSGLANAVAREIPQEKDRLDFLRQWESSSNTRLNFKQATATHAMSKNDIDKPIDIETLKKIREDYTTYIGPLSSRLVKYYSSNTNNLEQLINHLADEIPDDSDSQEFRYRWLNS